MSVPTRADMRNTECGCIWFFVWVALALGFGRNFFTPLNYEPKCGLGNLAFGALPAKLGTHWC